MPIIPILSVLLNVDYPGKGRVLNGVCLDLAPGEILGLVGQSGSGKSTLALSILRLLSFKGGSDSGSILYRGKELISTSEREMRKLRGKEISLVLQSPMSSLNPAMKIGHQLQEAWRAHSAEDGSARIMETLRQTQLPTDKEFLERYPKQLSVGLAQRVLIAMAVLHRPAIILADEPTSALDALTQAGILDLFRKLNQEYGTAILLVSHDLLSVASLCDRVAILHEGQIAETGTPQQVFEAPQHDYTKTLVNAIPKLRFKTGELIKA